MKRLAVVLAAWAVIAACTPTTPAPDASASASAGVKPAINEQTRGEIQALLQKQRDAMAKRDQTNFIATIDPERLELKRCENESYDIATRQGVGAVGQVGKIEPYLDLYVRAWVQEGSSGQRRLFFRKTADGKWVQTEPKDDELGGEKKTTVEDIQIDYWGIDQDVIDALGKATLAARKVVLDNLLSDNRRDALAIRFYPTRSVSGIQGCTVVGPAPLLRLRGRHRAQLIAKTDVPRQVAAQAAGLLAAAASAMRRDALTAVVDVDPQTL